MQMIPQTANVNFLNVTKSFDKIINTTIVYYISGFLH